MKKNIFMAHKREGGVEMTPNVTRERGVGCKKCRKSVAYYLNGPFTSKSVRLTEIKISRLTVLSKLSVYKLFKEYVQMWGIKAKKTYK